MFKKETSWIKTIPQYIGSSDNEIFDCNNSCTMKIVTGTNKQEYETYIQLLEQEGCKFHDCYRIKDNYFSTYIFNDQCIIHAYFSECNGTARIIADPNINLYHREQDVSYKKSGQTALFQMELDYRNIDCGMCYIVKCADNSFFIVDSAHMNSVDDHYRIYKLLRSLTPEGDNVVISGWFFSHAHQDHIVKFMDFVEAGFKDVTIERLYYNFPSLAIESAKYWSESDIVTMKEFDQLIENHPEIQVVKLHTGQRFYVRNLKFEVLSTHEDIYPKELRAYNDASTVLMMEVDSCKTLFLGDAHVAESDILVSMYGSDLQADIVQVAHHGFNGATEEIYSLVRGKVAFFPTSQKDYEKNLDREANKKVRELSSEIYVAGNGTVRLDMPYKLGTAYVMPKEISLE